MNPLAHPQRVARAREAIQTAGLDAVLVQVAANRRYLSGYSAEDGQFDETAGALVVSSDHLLLATDSRYELQARREAPGFDVFCYRHGLIEDLPGRLGDLGVRRLGFESVRMSVKQYQTLRDRLKQAGLDITLSAQEGLIESLRAIKDADEIAATREAVACAESALEKLRTDLRPGRTEAQIARRLEDYMLAAGAEAPSFPIIVAAGPNSAQPHAVPGSRPLRVNEPLLLDWGARVAGYCSDISRTLVCGAPDDTFRECYRVVREAQAAAIAVMRPGKACREVDAEARRVIRDAGFEGRFGHSLGHGTGLYIHEAPRLGPRSEEILAEGMLVTVEPGIYLPDWGGIRLENQVWIQADGAVVLNTLDLDHYRLPA